MLNLEEDLFGFLFSRTLLLQEAHIGGPFWEKMPPAQSTFCQLRQYRRYPAGLANFLLAEAVIGNSDRLVRFFHFSMGKENKTKAWSTLGVKSWVYEGNFCLFQAEIWCSRDTALYQTTNCLLVK